ncbi:jg14111 [Pararge aegeria aegeria]|uniref:Jg14111 protein n=1 Tax=Pararge aegeria aegeria TaxID=348720 RepID=A0A8S4RZ43_9NEOP|nr:jg14111 [Pararge aegeria aegeria]
MVGAYIDKVEKKKKKKNIQEKKHYFGHIARRLPSNIDKLKLVGKVEGKRPRCRSPRRWSDQVKSLTGLPITEAIKKAEDRTGWKAAIKIATKLLESGHNLQ